MDGLSSRTRGTLFLDEIGDVPLELQSGSCECAGARDRAASSMRTIRVDFRLIAATNRNLEEMVGTREFRLIYYRLNVSRPDSAATANGVKTS